MRLWFIHGAGLLISDGYGGRIKAEAAEGIKGPIYYYIGMLAWAL